MLPDKLHRLIPGSIIMHDDLYRIATLLPRY
jgi:hypothetical protein